MGYNGSALEWPLHILTAFYERHSFQFLCIETHKSDSIELNDRLIELIESNDWKLETIKIWFVSKIDWIHLWRKLTHSMIITTVMIEMKFLNYQIKFLFCSNRSIDLKLWLQLLWISSSSLPHRTPFCLKNFCRKKIFLNKNMNILFIRLLIKIWIYWILKWNK